MSVNRKVRAARAEVLTLPVVLARSSSARLASRCAPSRSNASPRAVELGRGGRVVPAGKLCLGERERNGRGFVGGARLVPSLPCLREVSDRAAVVVLEQCGDAGGPLAGRPDRRRRDLIGDLGQLVARGPGRLHFARGPGDLGLRRQHPGAGEAVERRQLQTPADRRRRDVQIALRELEQRQSGLRIVTLLACLPERLLCGGEVTEPKVRLAHLVLRCSGIAGLKSTSSCQAARASSSARRSWPSVRRIALRCTRAIPGNPVRRCRSDQRIAVSDHALPRR